jgi:hypothetical protein
MAEEESFKVIDRRGREQDRESPAPARAAEAPRPPEPALGPELLSSDQGTVDLQALFVMFASSALINLGEAEDPATGERVVDLDQAKDAIDLLLLLREKTAGNRTEHESQLLEQILYDVQMRYVRATGGSP